MQELLVSCPILGQLVHVNALTAKFLNNPQLLQIDLSYEQYTQCYIIHPLNLQYQGI